MIESSVEGVDACAVFVGGIGVCLANEGVEDLDVVEHGLPVLLRCELYIVVLLEVSDAFSLYFAFAHGAVVVACEVEEH